MNSPYKISLTIYRNTSKSEALEGKNFIVFFLKVLCDALSRLTIVGAWMFTINIGQFSTLLAVGCYYGTMFMLLLVNIGFTLHNHEDLCSIRNMIGKNCQASGTGNWDGNGKVPQESQEMTV